MNFVPSRRTLDRPKQTIHAAELFHDNARVIAAACADASAGEVVVATVDYENMEFGGVWTISVDEVVQRVPELEAGGWALIFSPGTTREDIEERSLQVARLAFARWEAMRRWASRR